jgi:hypothetical protein
MTLMAHIKTYRLHYIISAVVISLIAASIFIIDQGRNITTISPRRGPIVEAIYGLGTVKR